MEPFGFPSVHVAYRQEQLASEAERRRLVGSAGPEAHRRAALTARRAGALLVTVLGLLLALGAVIVPASSAHTASPTGQGGGRILAR